MINNHDDDDGGDGGDGDGDGDGDSDGDGDGDDEKDEDEDEDDDDDDDDDDDMYSISSFLSPAVFDLPSRSEVRTNSRASPTPADQPSERLHFGPIWGLCNVVGQGYFL